MHEIWQQKTKNSLAAASVPAGGLPEMASLSQNPGYATARYI